MRHKPTYPKPGEVREFNGQVCRFMRQSPRGEVWEVIGAGSPAAPTKKMLKDYLARVAKPVWKR